MYGGGGFWEGPLEGGHLPEKDVRISHLGPGVGGLVLSIQQKMGGSFRGEEIWTTTFLTGKEMRIASQEFWERHKDSLLRVQGGKSQSPKRGPQTQKNKGSTNAGFSPGSPLPTADNHYAKNSRATKDGSLAAPALPHANVLGGPAGGGVGPLLLRHTSLSISYKTLKGSS